MVTRKEREQIAEEKEKNEKSDNNYKFLITSLILLIPSVFAGYTLYQTDDLEDRLRKTEQRIDRLEEYRLMHALETKTLEKRIDSIQMARIDTSGK